MRPAADAKTVMLEMLNFVVNFVSRLQIKPAACVCRHFSNSYTLRDEYCHCLTSDATIMVSTNSQSLVNKLQSSILHNRLP